jgi:hypothetical protein
MYAVSIDSNSRVLNVYNTEVFVDPGVEVFEISEADVSNISKSGVNNDWVYGNNTVTYNPVAVVPTAASNKAEAVKRLEATDWVNEPDVYDTANTPHLTNRNAFLTYRSQVRVIAVSPTAGNLDWPTEPTAVWSV